MAQNYIGKIPVTGDFKKCDSITTADNTATYNLRVGSVAVYPESALHCIVQVNGIQQVGKTDYNIVNDTIVFTSNLMAADTINQVLILGNINDIGVPSDDTCSQAKIQNEAINEAKMQISNAGSNGQFLSKQSSNTGGLTWADAGGAADDYFASSGLSAKDLGTGLHIRVADTGGAVEGGADELVIENTAACGMSIVSGNTASGNINFADAGGHSRGIINYDHNADKLNLYSAGVLAVNSKAGTNAGISTSFNVDSFDSWYHMQLRWSANAAAGGFVMDNSDTNTNETNYLNFKQGNTSIGKITRNGTNDSVLYTTTSDYRLKENFEYDFDATTRLKQLKPARFNWKSNPSQTVDGFLAHEVSSIVPEAVQGTKDETETKSKVVLDKDGKLFADNIEEENWTKGKSDGTYPSDSTWEASKVFPKYQSMDATCIVPLLVKTIQELEARIKTLEDA